MVREKGPKRNQGPPDVWRGLGLLKAMPAAGVAADVVSYNAAISACEKGQQWQRALGLLEAMPAAGVVAVTSRQD